MARVAQFQMEVAEPWKNLIRASVKLQASLAQGVDINGETEDLPSAAQAKRVFEFNLAQQNSSWLILLDFADYLGAHLADVWHAIDNNGEGYAAHTQRRHRCHEAEQHEDHGEAEHEHGGVERDAAQELGARVLDLADGQPRHQREIRRHDRQHAGREERDDPAAERGQDIEVALGVTDRGQHHAAF